MGIRIWFVALTVSVLTLLLPLVTFGQDEFKERFRIVQIKEGAESSLINLQKRWGDHIEIRPLSMRMHTYGIQWGIDTDEDMIDQHLSGIENIAYFTTSRRAQFRNGITPNDPDYDLQWYMPKIGAHLAWAQSTGGVTLGGDTIVVAVLERRGADFSHEELRDAQWVNRQEIPNDGIDNDNNGYVDDYAGLNVRTGMDNHEIDGHSTGVTGLIGAKGNNAIGISGVNWAVKVLMISRIEFEDEIIEGLEYVLSMRERYDQSGGEEGAFVVALNASFGYDGVFPQDMPVLCSMFDHLLDRGILTASAVTNTDVNIDIAGDIPPLCESASIIAVTNTNEDDEKVERAGFSRNSIELGAPGHDIIMTAPGNDYTIDRGTSFSAPLVAGAIALLYSMPSEMLYEDMMNNPTETALRIRQAILDGVDKRSSLTDFTSSGGRLNIANAMQRLAESYGRDFSDIIIDNVYPNPTINELKYTFNSENFGREHEVHIYNMNGQLVLSTKNFPSAFGEDVYTLDVSRLPVGTYTLSIIDNKKVASTKFLKFE